MNEPPPHQPGAQPYTQQPPLPGQQQGPPLQQQVYKLSDIDRNILKQCSSEAFWYRGLPFGVVLAYGAHAAVKAGYLKGSAKWGPIPKIAMGATFGYFLGKLSYRNICKMKLMENPYSELGARFRQEEGVSTEERQSAEGHVDSYIMAPSLTTDMERSNTATELDDYHRPTLDSPQLELEEDLPETKSRTTYDDLRRQNRAEFERREAEARNFGQQPYQAPSQSPLPYQQPSQPYQQPSQPYQQPSQPYQQPPQPSPYTPSPDTPSSGASKRNKYGDVWEEDPK